MRRGPVQGSRIPHLASGLRGGRHRPGRWAPHRDRHLPQVAAQCSGGRRDRRTASRRIRQPLAPRGGRAVFAPPSRPPPARGCTLRLRPVLPPTRPNGSTSIGPQLQGTSSSAAHLREGIDGPCDSGALAGSHAVRSSEGCCAAHSATSPSARGGPRDYGQRSYRDCRLMMPIVGMKMRWVVIVVIHPDVDPREAAEFGHRTARPAGRGTTPPPACRSDEDIGHRDTDPPPPGHSTAPDSPIFTHSNSRRSSQALET